MKKRKKEGKITISNFMFLIGHPLSVIGLGKDYISTQHNEYLGSNQTMLLPYGGQVSESKCFIRW
jgi:hypothetical protein